jgi:GNAT superfamily N-acetyltransferase
VQRAFALQQANPGDFAALVALRHEEDWAPNAWLFAAVESSHLGYIVVARGEGAATGRDQHDERHRIIASAVGTAYGDFGIIGNVIVHASHRARGLGRAVMEAELEWLRQRGVRFVELDATDHGRPLYEKLGFVKRAPSWMLVDRMGHLQASHQPATARGMLVMTPASLPAIAVLDRQAFGGDRMPLLAAVLALDETHGWMLLDDQGETQGYIFVRPTERRPVALRVGPWIARSPGAALQLLRHAVTASAQLVEGNGDAQVLASVPGVSSVVTDSFAANGLPLVPDDIRMRLTFPDEGGESRGELSPAREDWVFGMLAPMVG